jgi:hypothetical protein
VLRGVHVHRLHTDYLVVLAGAMLLALHDIRPSSPSHGRSVLLPLDGTAPKAVVIPPGVAHGFYFVESALHIYGVDEYWDGSDEIGCRFDSPEMNLPWPNLAPSLSERDALAGTYGDMVREFFAVTATDPRDRCDCQRCSHRLRRLGQVDSARPDRAWRARSCRRPERSRSAWAASRRRDEREY